MGSKVASMAEQPKKKLEFGIGKRRLSRRTKEVESLLESWYGANAESAIAGHLPGGVSIQSALKKVTKNLIPPWLRAFETVRKNWKDIVGETGAKRLEPLKLDNKVLLLELRHPAYRMAFDTPAVKSTMIAKINEVAGEELCTEIRFVAPGMYARKR